MKQKKALIIGSGLGGLSLALRLSSRGYDVEMLEKYHQAGGRLNKLEKDGFTFDLGPSFFSMSYEFDELFEDCKIPNPIQFESLSPLYKIHFDGDERSFEVDKDFDKLEAEFGSIEPDFKRKLEKYIKNAGEIFHDTENIVVKNNFDSILGYLLKLSTVPPKHAAKMWRSMWKELENNFDSYEVKVTLSLIAFFLGDTPFNTPAVYKLLNYTELKHDGYWNVKGGMYKIVEVILAELEKRNVKIHYNTEVVSFESKNGKITGFIDQNNKKWEADLFISNSDAAGFRNKVMKKARFSTEKLDKMNWTLAPFTIYLGVKEKLPQLTHHNYFLSRNFEEYANHIFKTSVIPQKPYYYVNVSSRLNPEMAPEGCENLFILCPVPDLRFKKDWNDKNEVADNIIQDLSTRLGVNLDEITISKTIMTPIDWEKDFHLYRGSGLGLAHGLKQIGAFRPKNKDEEFSNLYYVGASTIPGTGLPMVIISSKLVTQRIEKEHE